MNQRENSKNKVWKKTDEQLLEEWSDHSKTYRWMHEQARLKYWRKNIVFQIPVIILSTITGAANFAQDRVPEDYRGYYALIVGFANIVAGIIATISTFLKVGELLEGHRVSSMSWGKYYHNVKTELKKEPDDRENVVDFMKYAKNEYEKLVEQSPPIPPEIINVLKEKIDNSGFHVFLPPIIGVFDKFQIAKETAEKVVKEVTKDKTQTEKVLEEIDDNEKPRTDRKLSKATSFIGNLGSPPTMGETKELFSNKLMSKIFHGNVSATVEPMPNIEDRVKVIIEGEENKL